MIAAGRNVNVTLIFSLERYQKVMDAYIDGLEDRLAVGQAINEVASVASFFISRVDSEVDSRLDSLGTAEALSLRGKSAIAQAVLAYEAFQTTFSGPRWEALAQRGAQVQRPLWASTSTKNPAYPDTLYVDQLIGPYSVNTLPDATVDAFADHGRTHGMLTNAVINLPTFWSCVRHRNLSRQFGSGISGEVGRSITAFANTRWVRPWLAWHFTEASTQRAELSLFSLTT